VKEKHTEVVFGGNLVLKQLYGDKLCKNFSSNFSTVCFGSLSKSTPVTTQDAECY
jgi:hypothetical protein